MSTGAAALVIAAGFVAGATNAVAGGGSLLTFPVLLSVGLSPLAANVTNTVGLVPGLFSGSHGYRRELRGQRARIVNLGMPVVFGSGLGVALLLTMPAGWFRAVVPWLIVAGCLALLLQPRLIRLVATHRHERSLPLRTGLVLVGVYGGYFGAAIGIMMLGLLALFLDETMPRLNATKAVLSTAVNGLAALAFMVLGPVSWTHAAALAAGGVAGGSIGAAVGRRLPAQLLRTGIALIGLAVAARLVIRG
jgi:uncharacterized membrane protein YfcA